MNSFPHSAVGATTPAHVDFGSLSLPTRSMDATSLRNIPHNLTDNGNLRASNGAWAPVVNWAGGVLAVTMLVLGSPSSIVASSPASANLGTAALK